MTNNSTDRYLSLTAKFQKVLDSQNLNVKGLYLGGRKMGVIGTTANVARAVALVGQIYAVDSITHLDDNRTAAVVLVPDADTARERFDRSVSQAT